VKKVYVVGMKGLADELKEGGLQAIGADEDNNKEMNTTLFKDIQIDKEIKAVICGWDTNINYYKMCYASICLQDGALFLATNSDPFDMINGKHIPAAGVMMTSIGYASEREAVVVGKPNPFGLELIVNQHKIEKSRCLMIGDRLDSDILLGINGKVDTLLVMTGVTSEKELQKIDGIKPTYVARNLSVL